MNLHEPFLSSLCWSVMPQPASLWAGFSGQEQLSRGPLTDWLTHPWCWSSVLVWPPHSTVRGEVDWHSQWRFIYSKHWNRKHWSCNLLLCDSKWQVEMQQYPSIFLSVLCLFSKTTSSVPLDVLENQSSPFIILPQSAGAPSDSDIYQVEDNANVVIISSSDDLRW